MMSAAVNITDVMSVLYSQSLQPSSIISHSLAFIVIFLGVVLLHDAFVRSKRLNTSWWSMMMSHLGGRSHLAALPGPWWNLPLLGYLPWLGPKPYVTLWNLSRRYGNVYQIRFGGRKVVVLNGRQTIREAFVQQGDTFAGRPDFPSFSAFCEGRSLGFSTVDPDWITQHKVYRLHSSYVIDNHTYRMTMCQILQYSGMFMKTLCHCYRKLFYIKADRHIHRVSKNCANLFLAPGLSNVNRFQ